MLYCDPHNLQYLDLQESKKGRIYVYFVEYHFLCLSDNQMFHLFLLFVFYQTNSHNQDLMHLFGNHMLLFLQ